MQPSQLRGVSGQRSYGIGIHEASPQPLIVYNELASLHHLNKNNFHEITS